MIIIGLMFLNFGFSQTNLKISFKPYNANLPYEFSSIVTDVTGEPFKINTLYYYVSNIHIIHDGGQDLDLSDTVIIVKNDENIFDFGIQTISNVEQINFGIGVPQALNHLDISLYPVGHPLSFQFPAMQWGWASGYNLIGIVGEGDVDRDGVTENAFELFSLGDDLYRLKQLPVSVSDNNGLIEIKIQTNIDELLRGIDPATVGFQHSGTSSNITMMDNILNYPVFEVEGTGTVSEVSKSEGLINYAVNGNSIDVSWSDFQNAHLYKLLTINGQEIKTELILKDAGFSQIANINSGIYWLVFYSKDGNQLNKIRIIK